jgi:hypothetical protein
MGSSHRGREKSNKGNGPADESYTKNALERLVTSVVKNTINSHPEYKGVDKAFISSFSKRLGSALLNKSFVSLYDSIVFDKVAVPKPCQTGGPTCVSGETCVNIKKIKDT